MFFLPSEPFSLFKPSGKPFEPCGYAMQVMHNCILLVTSSIQVTLLTLRQLTHMGRCGQNAMPACHFRQTRVLAALAHVMSLL